MEVDSWFPLYPGFRCAPPGALLLELDHRLCLTHGIKPRVERSGTWGILGHDSFNLVFRRITPPNIRERLAAFGAFVASAAVPTIHGLNAGEGPFQRQALAPEHHVGFVQMAVR